MPALVASFPHGLPRQVESLDIKARASEGRGGVKRPRANLEAETEHMRYSCSQPLANKKALAKYLVGVYSRSKGEVVLHPVESVLQVSQHIKVRAHDFLIWRKEWRCGDGGEGVHVPIIWIVSMLIGVGNGRGSACAQAVEEAEKAAKAKKAREQDEAKQGNYEKRKSLVESFGGSTTQCTLGDHCLVLNAPADKIFASSNILYSPSIMSSIPSVEYRLSIPGRFRFPFPIVI